MHAFLGELWAASARQSRSGFLRGWFGSPRRPFYYCPFLTLAESDSHWIEPCSAGWTFSRKPDHSHVLKSHNPFFVRCTLNLSRLVQRNQASVSFPSLFTHWLFGRCPHCNRMSDFWRCQISWRKSHSIQARQLFYSWGFHVLNMRCI
jgi:hypothetical protein